MSNTGNDIFDATGLEQTLDVFTRFGAGKQDTRPSFDAIEFRVLRPGSPVKRLQLTGNRYTLGSGDGCSIQLDDETLRPMHAVLLRDAHRILMRAYSVPLEINGARVNESALRVGDIIRMGQYRFELLTVPGETSRTDSRSTRPRSATAQQNGTRHLQDKLTELSQQWHARHAECEARESRCDERESELHGRESELWSRAENLQRRETALVSQEAAAREIQETHAANQKELRRLRDREIASEKELQAKQQELHEKNEELASRQQQMSQQQAQWKEREDEHVRRADEASRDLEQSREQARSAGESLQRIRDEFTQLNDQLTDLRERHNELQQRERVAQEEHERLRGELESARNDAIQASARSEAERQQTQAELDRVTQRLSEVTSELETTRREIAEVRQQSEETKHELDQRLQQTGDQLKDAQRRADQTQAAADASAQEVAKQQQELEAVRRQSETERQQADEQIEQLREQLNQLAEEKDAADARVAQGRSDIEDLREQLSVTQMKQSESEEQLKDGQREVATLRQQLVDLEQEKQNIEDAAQRDLDELRQRHDSERHSAEDAAEQLRTQISQLQQQVTEANEEASKLRGDYEGASASIRQLELLVDQTKNNQHSDHDSWAAEAEKLRQTIEDLSIQLATANAELGDLRIANESLRQELATVAGQEETDASGPTDEQWQALQDDLDTARSELETLRASHQETIDRIRAEHEEAETQLRDEIEQLRNEIAGAQSAVQRANATIDLVESQFGDSLPVGERTQQDQQTGHEDGGESEHQPAGVSEQPAALAGSDVMEDAVIAGTTPETEAGTPIDHPLAAGPVDQQDTNEGLGEDVAAENIWRAEGEQSVAQRDHLSDYIDEAPIDPASDEPSLDQETFEPSMETADEVAQRTGIHWQDESPEYAVEDAIEHIEYNVGQAIEPDAPFQAHDFALAADDEPLAEPNTDSTPWHEAAARLHATEQVDQHEEAAEAEDSAGETNLQSQLSEEAITEDSIDATIQPAESVWQDDETGHVTDLENRSVHHGEPAEGEPANWPQAEAETPESAPSWPQNEIDSSVASWAQQWIVPDEAADGETVAEAEVDAHGDSIEDSSWPDASHSAVDDATANREATVDQLSVDSQYAESQYADSQYDQTPSVDEQPTDPHVLAAEDPSSLGIETDDVSEPADIVAGKSHDVAASDLAESDVTQSDIAKPESEIDEPYRLAPEEVSDPSHSEHGEASGLAQMLIRDLASEVDPARGASEHEVAFSESGQPQEAAGHSDADSLRQEFASDEPDYEQTSQWSQLASSVFESAGESEDGEANDTGESTLEAEQTFVMEQDITAESADSQSWNFADSGYQ
ncbi:MAG: FHA domain-containing protein, partial [Planctomycetota bacterium]